ncbi:50S ribosomal protein L35 [Candidatus Shapirobacteria bacterium CG03_land_8_20_14_0_80_40_19]|uniref:Large ribosomal subunit protein bL35 n=4 Tax=Candidatus Shapironibacteriota TaxID=1752721 RepID=A0A2M7BEA4_9BACT|nr:MAG: 50S ribosomal protein L35 [Candidatus Shapirobacteria bacterium CG11_big_fil_rev_8_21_14_0_20_40_12]PIV01409.1 MAG: 50S ribosomal protein L35 [Candidatus Shapirobacteria bacterium CG03_land_8_20_14_0_80_40_19]PJC29014.1 MAG: 50S ribosomal protein L35 [Candidatus Shapirobacteria bacterium CG_4_9_14_0_2_um_filter_40_11]PJC77349.1 MAG: 50S ribosomal protein L35 [Candidatus Shapirobacteria bacterium CG_4_8_14_3_um_filter_39_11]
MNKLKIRKSVSRRVKITASGKVLHASNFKRHLRKNKSAGQKRRLNGLKSFDNTRSNKIKKFLGAA